jgi:hypothetical protein
LLVNRTLPSTTGFGSVTTNIGELANKGFEMTLNTVNIGRANLNWRSHLVFSFNRNKIVSLFGAKGEYTLEGKEHHGKIPDFQNEWFPGQPIDVIWNYKMRGIWHENEKKEAAKYGLSPGDIKAVDLNNDGEFTQLQDKMFTGYTNPRYHIGFGNSIDFLGNFTASIFLRAEVGQKRPFSDPLAEYSTWDRRNTPPFPYWTEKNKTNEWPRLATNVSVFNGGIVMYKPATFVRIQNMSLSYTLPVDITQRFEVQKLRIFGSARNVATFTKWPGWDPESLSPMPRYFLVGIDLSL